MSPIRPDRRVQRTIQLLHDSLLSLIQEKGFEALTVQDILDRANLGRATFYAHFDNKEDLLLSGFEHLRATLREQQRLALASRTSSDQRLFAFSREIFEHVAAYRSVFRPMMRKPSGARVEQLLHKMMIDLVRNEVRAVLPASASPQNSIVEPVVQFIAGGLFGLLRPWAEGKLRLSVDEVNTLFRKLALPGLKSVTR